MINDLKDLQKLLKLCRAQGVTEIDLGTLRLKFGDLPQGQTTASGGSEIVSDNPWANFPSGELSPEQLAYYSAGGLPENDPFNKEVNG